MTKLFFPIITPLPKIALPYTIHTHVNSAKHTQCLQQEYIIKREREYLKHYTTVLQPLGGFTTFSGDIHYCGISQLINYCDT